MAVLPETVRATLLRGLDALPGADVERARKWLLNQPIDGLTEKELEVLRLIVQCRSTEEIAEDLVCATGTVRQHIGSILSKLHLRDRSEAVVWAIRKGVVMLEPEV
jgi:DNA-binding NarL/FixJ family response regulator